MKKTATITWVSYYNYGTFLQAYALQQVIKSFGYDNYVLDDNDIIKKNTKGYKVKIKHFIFNIFSNKYRRYYKSEKESIKLYDNFKNRYILLEKNINISYLNQTYDIFICGSDQIWNPNSLRLSKKEFYYADFTSNYKISYAPSIGSYNIPKDLEEKFKNLIGSFNKLSAREPEGRNEMQRITLNKVHLVVDPTLLLSRKDWNKLLPQNQNSKEKYFLVYFLSQNPVYINAVRNYARLHGYKLKMILNDKECFEQADEVITAGPIQFLESIRNAAFVFTDSFHGSIFSFIFNIQFVTFLRFNGINNGQNSRVENLLSLMNLSDRLISEDNITNLYNLTEINFNDVETSLNPYIENSINYLKGSLNEGNM